MSSGLIASVIGLILAAAISAYGWANTEAGQQVATHFDADGQPDGWGSRFEAFGVMPLVLVGLSVLLAVLPRIDPRRTGIARAMKAYNIVWILVVAVLVGVHFMATRAIVNGESGGLEPRFIVGGLGYGVVADIASGSGWRRCSLHSKLMLAGTAVLIPVSVIGFAALEWNNPGTLGGLDSTGDRLWVAWFQGVTTRTAGFNTTDIGAIHDSTALMFIVLMVIGGGSTSTAGGIKVTTAIVLILATIAFFRRRRSLTAFGRSIGLDQVFKVMALTTTAILFLTFGTFALLLGHDGDFLDAVFEVASAFGTVGLSRGTTGELNETGRIVIMVIMFFGRVGPLTLGFFLATRVGARVRYPEGQVYLG